VNIRPSVPLRDETDRSGTCAAPGCTNTIRRNDSGRPARYCSPACRVRNHRYRQQATTAPITVEVDMGSATSRGRPAERAWLVRIRRGDRNVIVNTGLRRPHADRLAEQLTDLLIDTPQNNQTSVSASQQTNFP
jgi:hypothetical protein